MNDYLWLSSIVKHTRHSFHSLSRLSHLSLDFMFVDSIRMRLTQSLWVGQLFVNDKINHVVSTDTHFADIIIVVVVVVVIFFSPPDNVNTICKIVLYFHTTVNIDMRKINESLLTHIQSFFFSISFRFASAIDYLLLSHATDLHVFSLIPKNPPKYSLLY